MALFKTYFWKKAPFIRVLIPFAAGIMLQWYSGIERKYSLALLVFSIAGALIFSGLSVFRKFRFAWTGGLLISLVFFACGMLRTRYHDIRYQADWVGHFLSGSPAIIAKIEEPFSEKARSYKATARVLSMIRGQDRQVVSGKAILYFRKEEGIELPAYGSTILFTTPLQMIRSSGNPGAFDFQRYCLFAGVTHQVFLAKDDFAVIKIEKPGFPGNLLFRIREKVLSILHRYIKEDRERGLAEALLIGYRDDLDRTLTQSYSNTGVVHIIAISGLHLGLIYVLLVALLRPLGRNRYSRMIQSLLVIGGLWLFSLLAGAQPSVLRSALMFTCIVIGQHTGRKATIYNTLACSAFVLLVINPFWLWDVGFQLSYAAVLSIVIFMKPIYHLLYVKNKLLDLAWKLNSVTLAAQVLTTPISIFHFHQFPTWFILTNFVAVPLSSLILLGEILLCVLSAFTFPAGLTGKIISWLIGLMNGYVEYIEKLPFSLWSGLQIDFAQAVLLLAFIAAVARWLFERSNRAFFAAGILLSGFLLIRSYSFLRASQQHLLIVYNVSRHPAMDFIDGRKYLFAGDRVVEDDEGQRNFHLTPSRVIHRVSPVDAIEGLFVSGHCVQFRSKRILWLDSAVQFDRREDKSVIDLLILSGKAKIRIGELAAGWRIRQVVFDGSVSARPLAAWKRACDSLQIPSWDVGEKGAFVMPLN